MKANLIVAFFIISLILLTPAAARTYRWVDENGQTVYSQSRPPSGEVTVIETPPPAPASEPNETMNKLKARLDALNKSNEEKNEAKEKEEKAAKSEEIKKRNCQTAKEHLTTLEQHARLKMKMDDGNYRMLTEEEREADIEKTKKDVEKYCN